MSREERRVGRHHNSWLLVFDLMFYPWLLILLVLPMLYIYPKMPFASKPRETESFVEAQSVQTYNIVSADRVYLTVRLLEPTGGRVQVLLSGAVVGRFFGDTLEITAMRGEVLELDSRTELREVRVQITASTAQRPSAGQEYTMRQEIQPVIIR